MSLNPRRRSLLLLACLAPVGFSPIARAGAYLAPAPAEGPADLIRRVFHEVLISPRERAAMSAQHAGS